MKLLDDLQGDAARPAAPRGMTLVEIMIVITIMASIMGVVGYYVFGALDRANIKQAKIEIGKLRGMVNQYYLTTTPNKLPDSLEDLTKGPAPITKDVPNDPWGNPYVYEKQGGRQFKIYSPGPDGKSGTSDDVSAQNQGK
ncbi:MAG: type II secretion system protein GspG [Bradymonadaceae bacterium]